MKLSPQTVALWARVLQAVAGARLLLKAPSLQDASVQARFLERFAAHGHREPIGSICAARAGSPR
jgi:protein O-GlcNAc transferase